MNDLSIGIIPIDLSTKKPKYLLLKQQKGHWSFPKGHQNENEVFIETALREFEEETGVDINSLQFLEDCLKNMFEESYVFQKNGKTVNKKVVFYLGFLDANKVDVKIQESEIVDFRWVSFEECLELVQFESARNLIRKVDEYVNLTLTLS